MTEMETPRELSNDVERAAGETDQPGLDIVRNAVHSRIWSKLPKGTALRRDAISGLSSAVSNVPDGMANGALLGVSPVHGLYGSMVGPAVGGVFSSTQLMMITTMAAASLSATQALGNLEGQARLDGLFAMVILIGAIQLIAGIFKLGRLFRFLFGDHRLPAGGLGPADPQPVARRDRPRCARRGGRRSRPAVSSAVHPHGVAGPGGHHADPGHRAALHAGTESRSPDRRCLPLTDRSVTQPWRCCTGAGCRRDSAGSSHPGSAAALRLHAAGRHWRHRGGDHHSGAVGGGEPERSQSGRIGEKAVPRLRRNRIGQRGVRPGAGLPIQAAVGFGVVLSTFLYINRSSTDISLVELVEREDGRIEERHPPRELPSGAVTVLDVYGHLFYAGARTLEHLLPRPASSDRPVVVLRLRGLTSIGATLLDVLSGYAEEIASRGGRLYLTGVTSQVRAQVDRTKLLDLSGPVSILEATATRGESTRRAVAESQAWLVGGAATREE